MAVVAECAERITQSGLEAFRRVHGEAHLLRDLVRRLEADAVDVLRQPVGIVAHDGECLVRILLVNLHRQPGADAVALQEDHDLLDVLLLLPGARDLRRPLIADARHLAQPVDVRLDHIQRLEAEVIDDAPGIDRPNALDQAAAQVLADTLDRRRELHRVLAHLELATVLWMRAPHPTQPHRLARIDARERADHSHFVAFSLGDQLRHRVTVLFVLESQPFQRPFEGLQGGIFRHRYQQSNQTITRDA